MTNKIKENMHFDVETNVNFIAGPDKIEVGSRQQFNYDFKLIPMHEGQYEG